jgi:hypothetical protein
VSGSPPNFTTSVSICAAFTVSSAWVIRSGEQRREQQVARPLPLECFDPRLELDDDFNQLGYEFADDNQYRRGDFSEFLLGYLLATTVKSLVETFLRVFLGHEAEH